MTMEVPLSKPLLEEDDLALMRDALFSGWLAHGPYNKQFEQAFTAYIGCRHAITMNSCTSALFLAVLANGIRGEVVLPSFTFVASANAVETAGATCRFADVDYATGNVTAATIAAALTPRTEAVMVVHYAGQPCDMAPIEQLARDKGLKLIEDSAETIGGMCRGVKTGARNTGCFSFFPTKNLTTGEGGMYTTNDDAEAQRVRTLLGHGIASSTYQREKAERPWLRAATMAGYNFRMSNVLAALGVAQMKKLDAMNDRRRAIAARYSAALALPELDLPVELPGFHHVWQMYTVKVKGVDRTAFLRELRAAGIGASVHFDPPVHAQPYYRDKYPGVSLPVTEQLAECIVTLPMYPQMNDAEIDAVISAVKDALPKARR